MTSICKTLEKQLAEVKLKCEDYHHKILENGQQVVAVSQYKHSIIALHSWCCCQAQKQNSYVQLLSCYSSWGSRTCDQHSVVLLFQLRIANMGSTLCCLAIPAEDLEHVTNTLLSWYSSWGSRTCDQHSVVLLFQLRIANMWPTLCCFAIPAEDREHGINTLLSCCSSWGSRTCDQHSVVLLFQLRI